MCHPLLGAIGVAVDHVRRVGELHTAGAQRVVGAANVSHPQVENRFGCGLFLRMQVQPRAAAIEEGE